jgi:hydroxyethylthiazole kinase
MSSAIMPVSLFSFVARVRDRSPLVHCMTNLVVTNFTANALLALGAAPAMVVAAEEVEEFAPIASALSVNLGTLDAPQVHAMRLAIASARAAGVPWVLDPVAVGALSLRTGFARQLLDAQPTVIRGNASEIISLAGGPASGRGVDSSAHTSAALPAARALAIETQAIVAVSGATDYVTDGTRTVALSNGSSLMTRVTGTGCALSATVAAFVGALDDPADRWHATVAALAYTAIAGELAAHDAKLPGSFAVAYLDRLASVDEVSFKKLLRLEVL